MELNWTYDAVTNHAKLWGRQSVSRNGKEVLAFTPELLENLKMTGHIMGLIVGIA